MRRRRGRGDPRRRRRGRGPRHRRRVRHHGRVGAGHPGERRRSLRGHGRDQSPLGRDHGQDHVQARRDLPRPDDRAGRGSEPAEDAERDRPHDPAGRPHDHLPALGRHPSALRHLLGGRAVDHRPRRTARLPDPDDDRRAAVGHRHRGDGSAGPAQRPGHERSGRRGSRRREHPAAGQDRDDHVRIPPSRGVRAGARGGRAPSGRGGDAVEPGRRDPGRALDRGLRGRALPPRRARGPRGGARALHGPDPDERDGLRGRPLGPQGSRRLGADAGVGRGRSSPDRAGTDRRWHLARRRHAARRLRSPGDGPHPASSG